VYALAAGIALVNPSGVDWGYWAKRWSEFSVKVRESTIAREILPKLLPGLSGKYVGTGQFVERPEQLGGTAPEQLGAPPTTEEIKRVIADLESKFSIPKEIAPRIENYPEVDASDPEMQLLLDARERCRSRCVNGG